MKNIIKNIRKEKRISQTQLAKLTGISRPYLSEIENGKVNPSAKVILKIAKALGTEVEKMFNTYNQDVNHNVQKS
jgi:putative transcriptional regulator